MARNVYVGISNVARWVKDLYIGVGNTARRVRAGWIGVGGKARIFYGRAYLFRNGVTGPYVGGWTRSFIHETNGGTNYKMTRMAVSGNYLQGTHKYTDGTTESALYVCSNNMVNLTGYSKLVCELDRYSPSASSPRDGVFGAFGNYTKCQEQQLDARFKARAAHSNAKNSGWAAVTLTVNIASINESCYILYDNYQPNMNADIRIRIKAIYLDV